MAISGYADVLSVFPGDTLNLYVSTDAAQFRVDFYRLGVSLAGPLAGLPANDLRPGNDVPGSDCAADWGWPQYPFRMPAAWSSGVYLAMLVEVDDTGADLPDQPLDRSTPDGIDRKVLFVVRQPATAARAILLKIPTATYAAYNYTGGGSTYRDGISADGGKSLLCSLRRPGCGTGGVTTFAQSGTPYYQEDVYDASSDRMSVGHLEGPFIRWLEGSGYELDYCTDFDLHFDRHLLEPYQLLVSVGHDEYWSEEMRTAVTGHVRSGGHVAFFSGNTCFKYATFPTSWQLANNDTWTANGKVTEDSLTGVSYTHGNGRWDYPRQVVGYELQHLDHWALVGVTGTLGDVYADNGEPAGLIGYECDGTPSVTRGGMLVPTGPPTPSDFLILGDAHLDATWQDAAPNVDGVNHCTMGLFTNGGVTFTVGTVDWARVLASGRESRVESITHNVLKALSVRRPLSWRTLGGQTTSTPLVGSNADGRLEVFGRDFTGTIRHVWQVARNAGWSSWSTEGGTVAGDGNTETRSGIDCGPDGRLVLVARFTDGSIRYVKQRVPNGTWAPWSSLGGNVAGDPALGVNQDGRLEVFARGFDAQLYHAWERTPGGAWSAWASEGGQLASNVAVDRGPDGRLVLVARFTDGSIRYVKQRVPNGTWAPWSSLGGNVAGDPALGVNQDGRLEVFARGLDCVLFHRWQVSPGVW